LFTLAVEVVFLVAQAVLAVEVPVALALDLEEEAVHQTPAVVVVEPTQKHLEVWQTYPVEQAALESSLLDTRQRRRQNWHTLQN
jgi:biopolymer transport protein ExbD